MTEVQVARFLGLLERLTLALERIAPDDVPQVVEREEPPVCEHPVEKRIDFGVTGGVPDWECALCHYRTTAT